MIGGRKGSNFRHPEYCILPARLECDGDRLFIGIRNYSPGRTGRGSDCRAVRLAMARIDMSRIELKLEQAN